jgi:plasmid stabilization system protein ParE
VALFRFSRRGEADLLSIGAYTLRTWGENQAVRYIDDLEALCQMLAGNPELGRAAMVFAPACVVWRFVGTSCFTARTPEAF